jgi:hypothetical protein
MTLVALFAAIAVVVAVAMFATELGYRSYAGRDLDRTMRKF